VPGGNRNTAGGQYSFAAGQRAKALHDGSFVWADAIATDFGSTGSNQFLIRAAGGVGIGAANPLAQLAIDGNTRIDSQAGAYSEGLVVNCPPDMSIPGGYGGLVFHSATRGAALDGGTAKWAVEYNYAPELGVAGGGMALVQNNATTRLYVDGNGNVGMGTTSPSQKLHVSGNIFATGTITPNSDRNAKTDFAMVDNDSILARVSKLKIQQWRFKAETEGVKHIGPMAQDFREAFGLGEIPTAIATVDADGVAFAAIQGLNDKVEQQSAELKEKETEIAELKTRLEKLERLMTSGK
jgi:trimeric autotransporter adhesin